MIKISAMISFNLLKLTLMREIICYDHFSGGMWIINDPSLEKIGFIRIPFFTQQINEVTHKSLKAGELCRRQFSSSFPQFY